MTTQVQEYQAKSQQHHRNAAQYEKDATNYLAMGNESKAIDCMVLADDHWNSVTYYQTLIANILH